MLACAPCADQGRPRLSLAVCASTNADLLPKRSRPTAAVPLHYVVPRAQALPRDAHLPRCHQDAVQVWGREVGGGIEWTHGSFRWDRAVRSHSMNSCLPPFKAQTHNSEQRITPPGALSEPRHLRCRQRSCHVRSLRGWFWDPDGLCSKRSET